MRGWGKLCQFCPPLQRAPCYFGQHQWPLLISPFNAGARPVLHIAIAAVASLKFKLPAVRCL